MKKKIETGMTFVLIGFSFLIIAGLIAGIIDLRLRDTSSFSLYATVGLILACFCNTYGYIFPKLSNTIVIERPAFFSTEVIKEYIRDSGSLFPYITLGYVGLLFCIYTPITGFDAKWIVGLLLIFCYFQGLLTPFLGERKE